ncbi:MAG: hypothetical protein WDZ75_02015 [Candidatus Paceibacterota bacterium]
MGNTFEQSIDIFGNSMNNLFTEIVLFLPNLLAGILVLIIGLVIANVLGTLARKAIQYAQLDRLSEGSETTARLREGGVEFSPSGMVGWIVKWFFIIVTFIAVADIFGLGQVTSFLNSVMLYIPNVIAAVLILVVGIVLGDVLQKIVRASAGASRVIAGNGDVLGSIARWSVVVFSLFAALTQLGIAENLIQILVAGIVLALAISIGLGSKDKVRSIIDKL